MTLGNVSQFGLLSFLLLSVVDRVLISRNQQVEKTKVAGSAGTFQLVRNGKPYKVQGVGGSGSRELLLKCGGNSIRTWGADNAQEVLDSAEKDGLTVTLGIWLGHSDVFNYHNPEAVKKQFEMCKEVVSKYKNHKALLVWAFGNEMEGNGQDPAVWKAINDIAAMCKSIDPNHPTMTVVAEIGGGKVQNFEKYCPDVDILGINSYAGAPTLAQRYEEAKATKPYILTEFGPPGPWEVAKTRWEAPIEMSSSAKADYIAKSYKSAVQDQAGVCLGSYAFLWGNKQEGTATWFGLLLPNGTRLEGVDVLSQFWKGTTSTSKVPVIKSLNLSKQDMLNPEEMITATLVLEETKKNFKVDWVVVAEGKERFTGGKDEPVPESYHGAITESTSKIAKIKAPKLRGGYRVFAYVFDDNGGAAVANVPFFVDAKVESVKAEKQKIPLIIFDEAQLQMPFSPTGWMGNIDALKLKLDSNESPKSGDTCAEVTFEGNGSWAGVAWQYPAGDWGEQPQALDLSRAKHLKLWLRGSKGGEKVNIELGILKKDKKYSDSGSGKLTCTLTKEWKEFEIDLHEVDLSSIKTGFVFVVEGSGEPIKFYFDNVRYE